MIYCLLLFIIVYYYFLFYSFSFSIQQTKNKTTTPTAIPDFPVTKKRAADDRNPSQPPSQQQKLSHDEHKPAHVQNWLPPFPDPHLYAETPAFAEKNLTVKQLRKKRGKQNRKIQTALATLDDALGRKPINNYEVSVSDSIKADQPKSDSMLTDQNTNTTTTSSTNNTTTNLPLPTMPSAPTPIDKSNPHLSTLANAQHMDVDDDLRKPFSEVDENEKQRRKNKAAALLGIQYDRGMLRPEDIPTDRK